MGNIRSKVIAIEFFIVLLFIVSISNAEAADYFPLSVGNIWIYSPSYGDDGNRVDTIIGEETVNGIHTYIWNRQEAPDDNYNEKRWIAKDGSDLKIYKFWSNEGQDPAVLITPPWICKLNPVVGDTWVSEGDLVTIHVKSTCYVESINDTVTVPAGTFNNCIRIRELIEITENSSTYYNYEKHWIAPDVGPIMYRDYTDNWGSVDFSQELIGFSVTIRGLPGDINADGKLDLADIIYGLQVLSGGRH